MSPSSCAIGVDIGGTKIAAGLVAFPMGDVLDRRQVPTGASRGGAIVLDDVLRLCEELLHGARAQNRSVEGIGVGICELVDLEGKVASENCIAWKNVPVRERLAELAPAVIEADVRAAALAESEFGAGRPFRQFVYLTVGTGISCCLMLEGKPFAGAHGATGTLASSPLSVACPQCGEVNARTLEEIASGPALVERYRRSGKAPAASGEAVLAAAIAGDPAALRVVESGGEALGFATGWLVNVLDPEAIVLGGGLGLSEGPYWMSFVSSTRRHIWAEDRRALPILRAVTGADAGLIGAALAVRRHLQASRSIPPELP